MTTMKALIPCLAILPLLTASCAGVTARYQEAPAPLVAPLVPSPAVGGPRTADVGALRLTVSEAVLRSLEQNRSLSVQRYAPALRQTAVEGRLAPFDPVLSAQITQDFDRSPSGAEGAMNTSERTALSFTAEQAFTPGTRVGIEIRSGLGDSGTDTTRLGASVTQPLLNGFGSEVNLASLRQAEIDATISEYELRGFAESLAAQVETAYWNYALATRRLEIVTASLALAEQQLGETEERIKVGKLAEIELVAARSETALRREDLINARSAIETARLRLLRLVNPGGPEAWTRQVDLLELPAPPAPASDTVEEHTLQAMRMRPEINQAKLEVRRGELEVVATRNGLLPKLDLFLNLGKSGYSDSFFGSIGELTGSGYDIRLGVTGTLPTVNRAARAASTRSLLLRQQSVEAVENLVQIVQVDVRSAWVEVRRLAEQILATAASRTLQEEKARAETEKFRVGRSTSFQVAMAQRDLLASQVAEIEALVSYLKAQVELYRLEGSLLTRRGIKAPGAEPVELP
jgi:outer membrane protein TolC